MVIFGQQNTGAFDVSTPLGMIVIACAIAAGALMLWLAASTRPSRVRPAPPTMELRDETPAVVDLLTGGFEVDDEAMPATVVDLAARGWFTIDDIGGDRIVLHLRQRELDDPLTTYEERVMRHIRSHATEGIVPAPVLTLGPEGVSEKWFKGFRREVTAHARDLGLCHRRWDLRHLAIAWGAVGLAGAPAGIVASSVDRTTDPTGWGTIGNLLLGLSFVIAVALAWYAQRISRSDAQVDTAAGLEAAAHWRGVRNFYRSNGRFEDKPAPSVAIWERNLAYATALGLAPLVQRQIPFETEHDRKAWSLEAGHWRRVTISYGARVPSWGEAPWKVAFVGLVQAVVTGVLAYIGFYVASTELDLDAVTLTDDQRRYIGLAGLILAIVMAALFLLSVARVLFGLSDLFARRTVEGELVRRRELPTGHRLPKSLQWVLAMQSNSRHRRHVQGRTGGVNLGQLTEDHRRRRAYLAIDDGDGERIRAFRVRSQIYREVQQGARIRATHTPRLGYVTAVETLSPPRPSAADEPGVVNPLVADAVGKAVGAITTRLGGAGGLSATLAQMEQMTGPDGTPVLDEVDDDGVTLRERMAESQEQLDQLRHDPRVAGTPLLGQILDTMTGDGRSDDTHTDIEPHTDTGAHEHADRDLPPPDVGPDRPGR